MLRKILLLVLGLPIIGAVIMASCGKAEGWICELDNFSMEKDSTTQKTITITLYAYERLGGRCTFMHGDNPFVSSSYAMQPACIKWMNEINQNTINITLDRPLAIDGDTLYVGENFLQHKAINGMSKFQKTVDCRSVSYTQTIMSDAVNKIAFDTGIYNIKVSCATNDNRLLEYSYATTFK